MTKGHAETLGIGDTVEYCGERRRINSVKLGLIADPHFRLSGVTGLTSWHLCELDFRARYGDGHREGSGGSEEHSNSGGY